MKQKYIIIDVALCHDCNNCFMGCKDEYVDNDWPETDAQPRHGHRWINILRRERGVYARNDVVYLPMPCQHCENAPCIAAGDGAVIRREDGIVLIDREKAKGNKKLADSCPYGAIYYNDERDVPQKCTFCSHLLDDKSWAPGMPRCVHNCPTGALNYAEMEPAEMEAKAKAEGLEAYQAELNTKPHVLYRNLHKYTKNFITAGVLVNGDCYEGAVVNLRSPDGKIVCKLVGSGSADCVDKTILASQKTNFFGEFKFDGLEDGEYIIDVDAGGKTYSTKATVSGESLNLGFIKL